MGSIRNNSRYRGGSPSIVEPFAAERLIGQRHAAVCRHLKQFPLPFIPRFKLEAGGREETLAESIQGQILGGNALLASLLVQCRLKVRSESDYHCYPSAPCLRSSDYRHLFPSILRLDCGCQRVPPLLLPWSALTRDCLGPGCPHQPVAADRHGNGPGRAAPPRLGRPPALGVAG